MGCLGCLTVLLLLAVAGLAVLGGYQITRPPAIAGQPTTPTDGVRAQQKIFELVSRTGRGRPHVVTLSEREVNAFLTRHLGETADLPFRNFAVHLLGDGQAEIAGRTSVRHLVAGGMKWMLPADWLDRSVWMSVRARVTLEGGSGTRDRRHLRLDVQRFWLGRQRLPEVVLRILLDPGALRWLRAPVPDALDGVRIEPGRLFLQSSGA